MKLNHAQGVAGEQAALNFLEQQSCVLVARNWHCPFGEIDLIMKQGDTLLFVEVRYRKSQAYGGAAYSITAAKLAKLQRSVLYYCQKNDYRGNCRLDAVLLQGNLPAQWIQNITG